MSAITEKFSDVKNKIVGKITDTESLQKIDLAMEIELIYRDDHPHHILIAFEECPKGMAKGRPVNYPKMNLTPALALQSLRHLIKAYAELSGIETKEGLQWMLFREMGW